MIIIIVSTTWLVGLFAIWFFFGRDIEKPIITYEHYPPEGLDPMQIEYAATGELSPKSLYAMILYWVSQGNAEFAEIKGRTAVHGIEEPKEPKHSQILYRRLFRNRKNLYLNKMPKGWDARFTLEGMIRKNQNKVFASDGDAFFSSIVIYLVGWLFIIPRIYRDELMHNEDDAFFIMSAIFIPTCIILASCIVMFERLVVYNTQYRKIGKEFILLWIAFIGWYSVLLAHMFRTCQLYEIIAASLMYFGGSFLCMLTRKRTNPKLYGRVLGFRDFLKTAEIDKLRVLQKEDRNYGIDILPYTVIFGFDTDWTRKCELTISSGVEQVLKASKEVCTDEER